MKRVRIHAHWNIILDPVSDPSGWQHLAGHMKLLTRRRFPELDLVILHGDGWNSLIKDDRFSSLHDHLLREDLIVLLEDGRHVNTLRQRDMDSS